MVSKNPGESVTVSANAVASKPKYLNWTGSNTLSGTAKLPSGHRRLITLNTGNARAVADYYVIPAIIGITEAPWRAVIFAPNGSYITSTGTGDIPTIGTPTVRIGVNAPSKAVVKYPVMKNSPNNILASTFAGWSDGHSEAVGRGMEITVEYREASTGSMKMVFRGMIYQIESGEAITITAYDRLMDLAQYSDQYQSTAYNRYTETLNRASIGGSTYNFVASLSPGVVVACTGWSIYRIDCLSEQSWDYNNSIKSYIRHPLPSTGGYGPTQGNKIRQLSVKFSSYYTWSKLASHQINGSGKFILYRNGYAIAETAMVQFLHKAQNNSTNITAHATLTIDVDWTLEGSPSEYMVGAYVQTSGMGSGSIGTIDEGFDYKSGFTTVSSAYYSGDGWNWGQLTGNHPEIAINFEIPTSIATANVSTSGNNVYVQQSAFPVYSASYLSVVDRGIRIYIDYLISGAAGLVNIVRDLIEWAGLTPDMVGTISLASTTFYTTSTYDYMTCIQEILKSGNYAVKASIDEPGKVQVRSRHTVSETPSQTFTTDPMVSGKQVIPIGWRFYWF